MAPAGGLTSGLEITLRRTNGHIFHQAVCGRSRMLAGQTCQKTCTMPWMTSRQGKVLAERLQHFHERRGTQYVTVACATKTLED